MVKLVGFKCRNDEILLVERLLKEVVSVEPVIITTLHEDGLNRNRSPQFLRIPRCEKKYGPKNQDNHTKERVYQIRQGAIRKGQSYNFRK